MRNVRLSLVAVLVGVGAPTALVAQTLVARGGISMTVEGQMQGVFPAKGGISGFRFSHGVRSPRDQVSGLPTGKRQHLPLTFTKVMGVASPQLFSALTRNENLKSVVVSVPGPDGSPAYIIKLTNANISEIKQFTEVIDGRPIVVEEVSFTYQKIEVHDLGTGVIATDDWQAPQA